MSDLDDAFFYDDFDYVDEYGTADDLAEHALPSPVWISYDPNYNIESPITDCEEYFSDEYYDEGDGATKKKRRKNVEGANGVKTVALGEPPKKRNKLKDSRDIPNLKLPEPRRALLEPTVMWKSRGTQLCPSPPQEVVPNGQGKKVAILKDWREKFNMDHPKYPQLQASQRDLQAESCDLASRSELEDDIVENGDDTTILPPSSLTSRDLLQTQDDDLKGTTHDKRTPSEPVLLAPVHGLAWKTTRKRKVVQFDTEDSKNVPEIKPISS